MTFPYYRQNTTYTCGAAAMRMALASLGIKKSEEKVARLLRTNKVRGTWNREFGNVAEKFKLNYVVKRNATISDLRRLKREGYVVIVCYLNLEENFDHYAIVRRIDKEYVYFWDPWFGENHKFTIEHFNEVWVSHPKYEKQRSWLFGVGK